jgi:hypothetical protein
MSLMVWKAVLFAALFLVAGCTAYMSSFQSPFFFKFSLRELVQRIESNGGLNCSAGGAGGGGGGMSTGLGGIGRKGSSFHKRGKFLMQDDGC